MMVGPASNTKPSCLKHVCPPTGRIQLFENRHSESPSAEPDGRGKPAEAAADDDGPGSEIDGWCRHFHGEGV